MSDPISTHMICPKCGAFQQKADTCNDCGVVVAKMRCEPDAEHGKSEDPIPGFTSSSASLEEDELDGERTKNQVFAIVIGIVVCTCGYVVSTPVEMGLEEFVEAKKESFHVRNFKIAGTVARNPYESIFQTQSSDGRTLSSLKLLRNETSGYVSFDPRTVAQDFNEGDFVEVTGRFQRVPYIDGRSQNKQIMMAFASSIEVIDDAH